MSNLDHQAIIDYLKKHPTQHADVLIDYLEKRTDIFSRLDDIGHVTCSAFILSDDLKMYC